MKAYELRVGNWVLFAEDQTLFRVNEIGPNGLEVQSDSDLTWIEIETFEGIPITEEWLLKFGFEVDKWGGKPSGAEQKRIIGNDIATFELTCWGGDWWLSQIYGSCFGFTPIRYVHQLQNLYFALTGEELIFG